MQDISQDTLNEAAKLAQSARITLWEIDLTQSGGDRYFFCNEANEKGEAVTWQGQKYDVYPVEGSGQREYQARQGLLFLYPGGKSGR